MTYEIKELDTQLSKFIRQFYFCNQLARNTPTNLRFCLRLILLSLEIARVPVKDDENTDDNVVEVNNLTNVEITKDQIFTSHCIAAKPKRNAIDQAAQSPPPIIVSLC